LFGGLPGTKDEGLIHSALAAPRNLFLYEAQDDLIVLAVKLAFALAKNHGFAEGNERVATAAMIEFLAVNGYDLDMPDNSAEAPTLGVWIEAMVAGSLDANALCDLLAPFLRPSP
jgi:death-on-curing protein